MDSKEVRWVMMEAFKLIRKQSRNWKTKHLACEMSRDLNGFERYETDHMHFYFYKGQPYAVLNFPPKLGDE